MPGIERLSWQLRDVSAAGEPILQVSRLAKENFNKSGNTAGSNADFMTAVLKFDPGEAGLDLPFRKCLMQQRLEILLLILLRGEYKH
jgi:hypothetical protein